MQLDSLHISAFKKFRTKKLGPGTAKKHHYEGSQKREGKIEKYEGRWLSGGRRDSYHSQANTFRGKAHIRMGTLNREIYHQK